MTTQPDIAAALDKLKLMRMRCYSHADKSNSPKDMRDWIDSDYNYIKAALKSRISCEGLVESMEGVVERVHNYSYQEFVDEIEQALAAFDAISKEGE